MRKFTAKQDERNGNSKAKPQKSRPLIGSILSGLELAMPCFGQNLYMNAWLACRSRHIQLLNQLGRVHRNSRCFVSTQQAVKIPKIHTRRQSGTTAALNVFADVVFDGIEQAVGVFASSLQGIDFFHGALSAWGDRANKKPAEAGLLLGGEGGIRTRGKFYPSHAFQACDLNRSSTSPVACIVPQQAAPSQPQAGL
jgi:hypothetical protein